MLFQKETPASLQSRCLPSSCDPQMKLCHAPEPMHLKLTCPRFSPSSVQFSVGTLTRITQETPSDQLDTDITAVDTAQDAAKKAISGIAAPIQSIVSTLSSTDNPISLVHGISSFLNTLEKFNAVVGKLAVVRITFSASLSRMLIRCLDSSSRASSVDYSLFYFQGLAIALHRSRNLIWRFQAIIHQGNLDDLVRTLLSKMDGVYTLLITAGLNDIQSMKAVVERITRQTLECSYFIQAYCGKFRKLT